MAGIRLFDVHRAWEDYTGITLGIPIGLSPWLTGDGECRCCGPDGTRVGGLRIGAFEPLRRGRPDCIGSVANRVAIHPKLRPKPTCNLAFRARSGRCSPGRTDISGKTGH
jgi:hypothetical protein